MPNDNGIKILENEDAIENQFNYFDNNTADAAMQQLAEIEEYGSFKATLHKLVAKTGRFYRLGPDGRYPGANARDLSDLTELYLKAVRDLQTVKKKMTDADKSDMYAPFMRMLDYTEDLLIKDIRTLGHLSPAEPIELPKVTLGGRADKVTMIERMNKVSGNISERHPIYFVDKDGTSRKGFFTEDVRRDYTDKLKANIEQEKESLSKSLPKELKEALKDYLDRVLTIPEIVDDAPELFFHFLGPGRLEEQFRNNFSYFEEKYGPKAGKPTWKWKIENTDDEAQKKKQEVIEKYLNDPMKSKVFKTLCNRICANIRKDTGAFRQIHTQSNYYVQINQMNKTSIVQRNCAMSAVANLFGIGDLLAHSVNMKLTKEDGEEVTGVFMENGKGEDLKYISEDNLLGQVYKKYSQNNMAQKVFSGKAKKDLYSIQMLDYICNNVDRHDCNMLYQVDKKTLQVVGLQGIDNDLSFGTEVPAEDKTVPVGFAVPLKYLRYVPEELKDKILALDPAMLNIVLEGFDLSPVERDAAGKRLVQVQQAIRDKKILPLTDQEFEDLNLREESLKITENRKHFHNSRTESYAGFCKSTMKSLIQRNKRILAGQDDKHGPEFLDQVSFKGAEYERVEVKDENDLAAELAADDARVLDQILKNMKISDKIVWFGSGRFTELEKKANTALKYEKLAKSRLEKADVRVPDVVLKNKKKYLEALKQAADLYLDRKKDVDPETLNEAEKVRYDSAVQLRDYAAARMKVLALPKPIPDPAVAFTHARAVALRMDAEQHIAQNKARGIDNRSFAAWKVANELEKMDLDRYKKIGYDVKQMEHDISRITGSKVMERLHNYAMGKPVSLEEMDQAYEFTKTYQPLLNACSNRRLAEEKAAKMRVVLKKAQGEAADRDFTEGSFLKYYKANFAADCLRRLGSKGRELENQVKVSAPKAGRDPLSAFL